MVKPIRIVDMMIFAASLFVMAMIVAGQLTFLQAGLVASDENLIWHLIRATGFVGYLALGGSMVWGLWLTTGASKNLSLGAWTMAIHVTLSWIAVVFSLIHALLLLVDKHFDYGLLDILLPFRDEFEPIAIGMGIIAFWLALLINLSFQIRKWLGRKAWKLLHLISYLCFGMVTYHTLIAGTDHHLLGLRLATVVMLIGTIVFLFVRVISTIDCKHKNRKIKNMRQTRLLMGMPITIEIVDSWVLPAVFDRAYACFQYVDETFSPYKDTSEVTRINQGDLDPVHASPAIQLILRLAEQTYHETDGYFNVWHYGIFNPSGIVKGWAIHEVAKRLRCEGFRNFYVDAGGDIQVYGFNAQGHPWRIGIRNPFDIEHVVKVLLLTDCGVATSGPYMRGDHIYNPRDAADRLDQIVSMTVIGTNIYEADRFATAAFAMGANGILFIESLPGFEGYVIDKNGRATSTSHFTRYG